MDWEMRLMEPCWEQPEAEWGLDFIFKVALMIYLIYLIYLMNSIYSFYSFYTFFTQFCLIHVMSCILYLIYNFICFMWREVQDLVRDISRVQWGALLALPGLHWYIPLELIGRCGLWKVSIIAHCLMVQNMPNDEIFVRIVQKYLSPKPPAPRASPCTSTTNPG